jgi:hypothetical protein
MRELIRLSAKLGIDEVVVSMYNLRGLQPLSWGQLSALYCNAGSNARAIREHESRITFLVARHLACSNSFETLIPFVSSICHFRHNKLRQRKLVVELDYDMSCICDGVRQ